ncbi:group-specific protein [Bacillus shivajii]|uniref:group-specific protein n=1 Tax=Bacillus shivajii TaxID=1983719 RepID=UPI001CFB4E49|nr:group-specific protein [Bacillus shivajii]UCZ51403.1 group-specific protein [Bacillus shivajii]
MGKCNIDHSLEDVKKKLAEQSSFLSESMNKEWDEFLKRDLSQETLNEAFHLLKKYDLATSEEQEERKNQMKQLFASL